MKTKMIALLGLLLAVSAPLFAKFKNNDRIEHFATLADAMARTESEAKITATARVVHATGACMGAPIDFLACQVNDFKHTQVGDRVSFVTERVWPNEPLDIYRPDGVSPITACHRVVWIEKDGTLAVQQDRWPWKTAYVTPKNYVGTITLMCTWGK